MAKATLPDGRLRELDCYVRIDDLIISINNLPELSDTKKATYESQSVIGRSSPLTTYSHSDPRQISLQFHFFATTQEEIVDNLTYLAAIRSAVYPRKSQNANVPFIPPVICAVRCGLLLADTELNVVLESYSVKFPTEVAWDFDTMCPYKFDVDTTWQVVYSSNDLPTNSRIFKSGR